MNFSKMLIDRINCSYVDIFVKIIKNYEVMMYYY